MTTTPVFMFKSGATVGPLFPDHWCLFVPTSGNTNALLYPSSASVDSDCRGDIINVQGDSSRGFEFEVVRNWSLLASTGQKRIYHIGDVSTDAIFNPLANNLSFTDAEARTEFERTLLQAPVPGKSLHSSSTGKRVQVRNCQTWLVEAVDKAVAAGILHLTAEGPTFLGRAL